MRSFVSAVFFILMTFAASSYAGEQSDLFEVRMLQLDDATEKNAQQALDDSLLKAIRIELIRLTGNPEFLVQPEAETFVQSPKAWLKSYRYEPYEQEGVKVGTWLVFEFDQQRFYRYFQQQGLVIWPMSNRPKTLVMGSQLIAGTLVKLNQSRLSYLPKLNYRNTASQLGLPIETPVQSTDWVYPDADGSNQRVADILQSSDARYLLSFQVISSINGSERYKWQLFNRNGISLLQDDIRNEPEQGYFEETFSELLRLYSASYREQAEFLGSLTLTVDNVQSVEQLTELEKRLKAMKPSVHQVRLTSVEKHQVVFELVYQGEYIRLVNRLAAMPGLVSVRDDAVIGQVNAEWE